MVACTATINIYSKYVTVVMTKEYPVPCCIPQWIGWSPREIESSVIKLEYPELAETGGNCSGSNYYYT